MMLNMVQADHHIEHANISQSSRSIKERQRASCDQTETGTKSTIRFHARLYDAPCSMPIGSLKACPESPYRRW